MRKNIHKLLIKICSVGLILSLIVLEFCAPVYADNEVVVVSLGDSYASGEGLEPYYGQDKDFKEKIQDENWLAHRSQNSWESMLEIPCSSGGSLILGNYWSENPDKPSGCTWYFKAVSGATTQDIINEEQEKKVIVHSTAKGGRGRGGGTVHIKDETYTKSLSKQINIFDSIDKDVDYVTISIGGNDVKFSEIISTAATSISFFNYYKIQNLINEYFYSQKSTLSEKIRSVYDAINEKTNSQTKVIVVGYPKLFSSNNANYNAVFPYTEVTAVNNACHDFNAFLKEIVKDYDNFYFADVEQWFVEDGDHGVLSDEPWINNIVLGAKNEDLDQSALYSSASFHPNAYGARGYADCVNAVIESLTPKYSGTLSGKVCKASDDTAISNAALSAWDNDGQYATFTSDTAGEYSEKLPAGDYRIDIAADGYIPCSYYTSIAKDEEKYEEVLLLVEGQEGTIGSASGTIRNALTSSGVAEVTLSFRDDWNNTEYGEVIDTITSASDGSYSISLPIGNYTMIAEKDGYITATKNIVVQESASRTQDCTIVPTSSDENYQIILTWGENPCDLDSHMVGMLSDNATAFHVYYNYKSQYDGEVEVCNLDVDDTTSYGPETITLNTTSAEPYYYYIHRYSGDGYISTSNAQIKVFHNGTLIKAYNAPTSLGDSDYWNVFAIVNGELVSKNTITNSPDISYVSSSSNSLSMSMSNVFAFDGLPEKESAKENTEDSSEEGTAETESETSEETSAETAADSETTEEETTADASESSIVEETLLETDPEKTLRMVLTWGENPRDLDSHVVGTLSDGNPFHVYYGYVLECDDIVEVCSLDTDETSGNGTETIVLNPVTDTPYYYYIYKYAGSGDISTSGAQITVYQGEDVLQVIDVPTDQGVGDYWNVFAVVNGELVVKNTVTETADRTYADPVEESEAEGGETEEEGEIVDNLPAKDIPLEELLAEDTSETEELTEEEQILEETIDDLEEQILSELSELEESASEQETDEPEAAETVTTEKESTEEAAPHGKRSKRKPAA